MRLAEAAPDNFDPACANLAVQELKLPLTN